MASNVVKFVFASTLLACTFGVESLSGLQINQAQTVDPIEAASSVINTQWNPVTVEVKNALNAIQADLAAVKSRLDSFEELKQKPEDKEQNTACTATKHQQSSIEAVTLPVDAKDGNSCNQSESVIDPNVEDGPIDGKPVKSSKEDKKEQEKQNFAKENKKSNKSRSKRDAPNGSKSSSKKKSSTKTKTNGRKSVKGKK